MDHALQMLMFVIGVAMLFDFLNGLHDAAKSILIIVATLVPRLIHAVARKAFVNVIASIFTGWWMLHTMGSRITRLSPQQDFCAETGGAITVSTAAGLGMPVSTTHMITGAMIAVGTARCTAAVRCNVARSIVTARFVTMSTAISIGGGSYFVGGLFHS